MEPQVVQQKLKIAPRESAKTKIAGLVLSVRRSDETAVDLVIGCPGLPNLIKVLEFGDAILYETPHAGVIEVRVLAVSEYQADLLITPIAPRLGLTAGIDSDNSENSPLQKDEIGKVRKSLDAVFAKAKSRTDLSPEQLDLLRRKLDEMTLAASRMGRKDWLMFVAGTLTNIIVGAAFSPDAAKAIFQSMNSSLGWLFQNTLRLIM